MQNKNIEILNQKISNIHVSIDDIVKEKLELIIDSKSAIREPIDENDTTLLLSLELNIKSNDEMVAISITNDIIFDLHSSNNEYEKIAEHQLIPMATKETSSSLDKILLIMGYNELDIANKLDL